MSSIKSVITSVFMLLSVFAFAQSEKNKTINHFIGIQANPLLQQILSFGGAAPVANPYLMKYTLKPKKSPFELNVGIGYDYESTEQKNGAKILIHDLSGRIGIGYKKMITKKFECGIGLDIAINNQTNKTTNITSFQFIGSIFLDSTITTTNSINSGFGGGFQFNMAYHLNQRMLIGTEATYYYLFQETKANNEIINYRKDGFNPLVITTTIDNSKNTGRALDFNLPVAIFLIVKF